MKNPEMDGEDSTSSLKNKVVRESSSRKSYTLDLKIHTPASMGYVGIQGLDTAQALVRLAQTKGLDVIGITDLHSGSFIDQIQKAAEGSRVSVIPGVELRCTVEHCNDINLTCLFPEEKDSAAVSLFLNMLEVPEQANLDEKFIVKKTLPEIFRLVEDFNGLAFPSRIDKTPGRMRAVNVLVEQYGIRTFDIVYPETIKFFKKNWPKLKFNLFSFSNANALAQVGSRVTKIKLDGTTFKDILEYVKG